MYQFPKDLDLSHLVGCELTEVCIDRYNLLRKEPRRFEQLRLQAELRQAKSKVVLVKPVRLTGGNSSGTAEVNDMNMLMTLESEIARELTGTERLLWAGQPRRGIVLRASDVFMIPFSLLWGGFVLLWEAIAILGGAPWFFALWGVPFVLMGLYLIAGRFLWDARRRSRTFYGLTNQRVIIVSGGISRKVTSLNLKTLSDISLTERSDGTGTITFGSMNLLVWWTGGTNWPGAPQGPPSFEMVQDAQEVYDILRQAQSERT